MKIGYAKLGRALHFRADSWGMQGDPAAPRLLRRLAERSPNIEFHVLSKNDERGRTMEGYPPNIFNLYPEGTPRGSWDYAGKGSPLTPNWEGLRYEWDVVEPFIENLDGLIIDLGQHGTSHHPIPQTKFTWEQCEGEHERWENHPAGCKCKWTHPQTWSRSYGAAIIRGANRLGDRTDGKAPVVYICEDSRNFHKARDFKWPTGMDDILAQHNFTKVQVQERFKDPRGPANFEFAKLFAGTEHKRGKGIVTDRSGELWQVPVSYRHGGCEFMIMPDDWERPVPGFNEREDAGIATTAYWTDSPYERRSFLTMKYLMAEFPEAKIFGKWDKKSLDEYGGEIIENDPGDFEKLLEQWKVTLALPPAARTKEGAFWTTAKPWQCFAAGVITFFIYPNDILGWMIPTRKRYDERTKEVARGLYSIREDWTEDDFHLATWLRPEDPESFHVAARAVCESEETFNWLQKAQRNLLRRRWNAHLLEQEIERKLCLA